MKYWYVWYDAAKHQYQIEMSENLVMTTKYIAIFRTFDMAYDYVTKANKMTDVISYSRWAR